MAHLAGKKILLGVCGSIAAYKSVVLARWFMKQGAEVKVVLTNAAKDFVTPLTFSTLTKNEVLSEISSDQGWNNHVELGLWANAIVIAPLTATTMSKMASGNCDNMLTASYLSAVCPVWVAPAMDLDMWNHPATKRNLQTLIDDKVQIIYPAFGELASGLTGFGRMTEPEDIGQIISNSFDKNTVWSGKKVLLTAGPTFEAIDPVRFIGNRSSGKMGIALAENLARKGAIVDLILGPTHLRPINTKIVVHNVESAEEMCQKTLELFSKMNVAILAAAVADFKPKTYSDTKIKKATADLSIQLESTTDIAATLGEIKSKNQVLVGFALETNDEIVNAQKKLEKKNFDMIVLNSLNDPGAGFQHDTNKISILSKDNKQKDFKLKSKVDVAEDIICEIENYL